MGANEAHSADGDGCVLEQRLGRVGPVDDDDQGLEQTWHVLLHVSTQLDGYFTGGPASKKVL